MKSSKKYPTVKVRPLPVPRKPVKTTDFQSLQGEIEVIQPENPVLDVIEPKETPELEPKTETTDEKMSKSTTTGENLNTESGQILKQTEEILAEKAVPKIKMKIKRLKKALKPASKRALKQTLRKIKPLQTDFTTISEDIKIEKDQKSLVLQEKEDKNTENESISHIETHENASISGRKSKFYLKIFRFVLPSKPSEKTVFLRKVYFILFLQIAFTCIWTGIVTSSSDLQDIMRENYWLIVILAFVLIDILWVILRFRGVFRKVRYGVVLGVVLVGGM